jgi:hypothetical protein
MIKPPFILYFLAGANTMPNDIVAARELKANVAFRNASKVPAEGALEKCDGVAGAVPARYAAAFPTATQALAAYDEALAAVASKVGGNPVQPVPMQADTPVSSGTSTSGAAPWGGAEKPASVNAAEATKAGWKPNT